MTVGPSKGSGLLLSIVDLEVFHPASSTIWIIPFGLRAPISAKQLR
jgi:hypothetical protein